MRATTVLQHVCDDALGSVQVARRWEAGYSWQCGAVAQDLSAAAAAAPDGVAVASGHAGRQMAHLPGESGVRGD
jgi:hypothetical protein